MRQKIVHYHFMAPVLSCLPSHANLVPTPLMTFVAFKFCCIMVYIYIMYVNTYVYNCYTLEIKLFYFGSKLVLVLLCLEDRTGVLSQDYARVSLGAHFMFCIITKPLLMFTF